MAFLIPLPVLRVRAGVRVFFPTHRTTLTPNPLPEYRERGLE